MNSIEQDKAIEKLRQDTLRLAKLMLKAQEQLNALANQVQALLPTARSKGE